MESEIYNILIIKALSIICGDFNAKFDGNTSIIID